MRRERGRQPGTLFRGSELPRLLTMVVMLGVLYMLITRASDPATWRFLAAGEPGAEQAEQPQRPAVAVEKPPAAGPTDEDAEEADAAREEFAAVTDKRPLEKVEMPAYWRLMGWVERQSIEQLQKRADDRVRYRELWNRPERWRGKLVEIPLHLQRALRVDDLEENAPGLAHLYEVWGWNKDSRPNSYWLVVPDLPPGMPEGETIYADATFVGYFLKLMPYEDHLGKTQTVPLLIGKLVWHPVENPLQNENEWQWTWLLAGGLLVLMGLRWGLALWPARQRKTFLRGGGVDQQAVDSWLTEQQAPPPERQDPGDFNGHGEHPN